MRDVIAYLPDLAHQHFDAVQHQVEILGNPIPFVVTAAERDTLVKTAEHDLTTGGVDGFDPTDRAAGYQDARNPRETEYQHDAIEHGHLDLAGKVSSHQYPFHQQPVAVRKPLNIARING